MNLSKISLKYSVLIISIAGIIFYSILGFPSHNYNLKIVSLSIQKISGLPVRLKIPSINVNAVIESVSLTSDGAMDVPKGPDNAAWFNLGPRPGQVGSSVIDGHSGYKNNQPAIFDNLYKLQKGDKIYIRDEFGATITFIVRESLSYDPKVDASSVFSSDDGKAHLNLITCNGIWDPIKKTHSTRLVVFTDKE